MKNSSAQSLERNRLLRFLDPDEYAWISPHLKSVTFNAGDTMADEDEPFPFVYFVESAVVSLVNSVDGATVEVGTVGNEGMAGLNVFLDGGIATSRTFVQVPGDAKRMRAEIFRSEIDNRPALRKLLHRYTQAYLAQVSQTAACNRVHQVEQRCARWLLMTHDRVDGSDTFPLTHQYLAFMLGVRRAGVTVAAGSLKRAGLINYSRGKITIVDREGLERVACKCYGIVRAHFDRLLT